MSKSVHVIGAGPGGLAAAMLLAAGGAKVKIFESAERVGGRTSALEAQGYRFDLGPTFFLYPQILEQIFSACGRTLQEEVRMVRLDPQYRIIFGKGGKLDCTSEISKMVKEIATISPEDALRFESFLNDNRTKFNLFRPCLEQPFLGWKDIFTKRMINLLPRLSPHLSVDSYLGNYFKDERVRLAFSFQSKYLGMSPFRCPSLFSILSFLEYEHGVFHPLGGCSAVTEAMARVAQEMGVEIYLNDPVHQILFQGRKAVGLKTQSGVHKADAVVVNADFGRAMQKLIPDSLRSRWTDRKISKKKFSCSTFMLYLGVEGTFDLPHHSIYIADDYNGNLRDIEDHHRLSDQTSFYVQNACVTDPTLAPANHSALYVLAPVSHRHENIDWETEKQGFRRKLLDQLHRAGYGNIEGRIRFEKMITPNDWENQFHIYKGATFNLSHSLGQLLHFRPRNRFEDVDGVYLVGGGTHPGSGLPVIFESARISSKLLLDDLGITSPAPSMMPGHLANS